MHKYNYHKRPHFNTGCYLLSQGNCNPRNISCHKRIPHYYFYKSQIGCLVKSIPHHRWRSQPGAGFHRSFGCICKNPLNYIIYYKL